ncbi:c-type cytochrome biogenesis protein CcmI [Halomonas pacifica]|uniref:C-type cytochrome biogenesis protein CcmI n=1 Tax=Bisbaumannia pacifica TaxID=77098 RepID=A0A510X629_9GAMM|nr:c-type cytochrome biogenesis protein CcmI [Halomonas pacifica]MBH8579700.1 c-type cytochrome biogenesis protein CcmI [Halomonas pacifica]MDC8805068.1 c-type cytochrome biogenesis protein CcmI [Halomonas pacifica]GEK46886.1 c-type cytochrome biogenesis protein CcmI [Halomonas pacifica]
MTQLWIAFALLLVPALWLLSHPLRRAAAVHAAQRDFEENDRTAEQNVAVFRRRLASLEAARERGEIDAERFAEDRLELERSLLEDTADLEARPLKTALSGRLAVPLIMVTVVIAAVAWYQQEGEEDNLALYTAIQEARQAPEASAGLMIQRLEQEAARQPDNPNVWMSLYPLYRDTGQGAAAIRALERLIELEGRQVPLVAQLAQIEFFVANRTLTEEVQALVDEVLAEDPRQPTVQGMLGIAAFDSGRYEQAIEHWRRAVAGFEDPASAEALRQGIAVAQERLGASREEIDATLAEGPGLNLRIALAEGLGEGLDEATPVFVVARDVAGELPPLAVARLSVADLPATLRLSDADAMSPQARLSQVSEARLVVRVSRSGQAAPEAGDLFGEHGAVALQDADAEPIEVRIDRIVD